MYFSFFFFSFTPFVRDILEWCHFLSLDPWLTDSSFETSIIISLSHDKDCFVITLDCIPLSPSPPSGYPDSYTTQGTESNFLRRILYILIDTQYTAVDPRKIQYNTVSWTRDEAAVENIGHPRDLGWRRFSFAGVLHCKYYYSSEIPESTRGIVVFVWSNQRLRIPFGCIVDSVQTCRLSCGRDSYWSVVKG